MRSFFTKWVPMSILLAQSIWGSAQTAQFEQLSVSGLESINIGRGASAWGDYNNDGKLELLISGESGSSVVTKLYKQNESGTYVDVTSQAVTSTLQGLAVGTVNWVDYNNDGNLDFFITGTTLTSGVSPVAQLYTNSGAPDYTFTQNTLTSFQGVHEGAVAWGDFNNDGYPDLALAGRIDAITTIAYPGSTNTRAFKIYKNNGDGSFTDVYSTVLSATDVAAAVTYALPSLIFADFDGDGYLDLFAGGYPNPNRGLVFQNNQAGGFKASVNVTGSPKWRNLNAAVGDFDKDGDLDIVALGQDNTVSRGIRLYRNDGISSSATFTDITTAAGLPTLTSSSTGLIDGSVSFGDYNNDGYLDILYSSDNTSLTPAPTTQVYVNQRNGTFVALSSTELPTTGVATRWGTARWVDFDNDGKLDISLTGSTSTSNYTTGAVSILHNISSASANTAPTQPTGLTHSYNATSSTLTLTWTNATDNEQGSSLTYNLRVGTTPGGSDVVNAPVTASNTLKIQAQGSIQSAISGTTTSYTLTGITAKNYYWSVQAVDYGYKPSAWAKEQAAYLNDQYPGVQITSPATTIKESSSITFTISATDNDGTIASVELYNGSTKLGDAVATGANEYTYTWTNIAAGNYSITAVATDNVGAATTSASVSVTAIAIPTNASPSINIVFSDSNNAGISWNFGTGSKRVVLLNKLASSTIAVANLEDGKTYSVGSSVGDWTVISNDATTQQLAISGLYANQSTGIAVFEYVGANGSEIYGTASVVSATSPKHVQTIADFADVYKYLSEGSFSLQASSSLGAAFPVTYSLSAETDGDLTVASLNASVVTLNKAGQVYLKATQVGNDTTANATLTVKLIVSEIARVVPTIVWNNPADITFGTALGADQLNASVSGIEGSYAYTPVSGTILNAGASQTILVEFTPKDATHYQTGSTTISINVNKAIPVITWETPSAITYGTALSSKQLNASVDGNGTATYTPATGTLNVGTHTLLVEFAASANYVAASKAVSLVVNKAIPVISWNTPSAITYGTALSTVQLNASVEGNGAATYTPATGTLKAGTQTLLVEFASTDNYEAASKTVSLVVNKAVPSIVWNTPSAITYGTALSATQLNASVDGNGEATYTPATGTLNAGTQTLLVNFAASDNYVAASKTVSLVVNKAIPAITWATPSAITYGTALSADQLNASVDGNGLATYTPATGTLSVGTYTLLVNFAASTNYVAASKTVSLVVNKAIPAITWATPSAITYGTALSSAQLNASVEGNGVASYTPASGTLNAGTQTLLVEFAASANYEAASKTVSLVVNKAIPTVSWAAPTAITYGTALSAAQLNASVDGNGTASYTPATGTLSAGTQSLHVDFAESANYVATSKTVSLVVNKAVPSIVWNTPSAITYGTALSTAQLNASVAGNGTATYTPATGTLNAGTQSLRVDFAESANYLASSKTISFTVNKAKLLVTVSDSSIVKGASYPATYKYSITGFVNNDTESAVVTGTPSFSITEVSSVKNGDTLTITASIGTLSASNYDFQFQTGTLSIEGSTLVRKLDPALVVLAPNPVRNGNLTVYLPQDNEPAEISIISINGTLVLSQKVNSSSVSLDISNLPASTYYVRISNANGIVTKPIIKL